jgi:hypothetical protein
MVRWPWLYRVADPRSPGRPRISLSVLCCEYPSVWPVAGLVRKVSRNRNVR